MRSTSQWVAVFCGVTAMLMLFTSYFSAPQPPAGPQIKTSSLKSWQTSIVAGDTAHTKRIWRSQQTRRLEQAYRSFGKNPKLWRAWFNQQPDISQLTWSQSFSFDKKNGQVIRPSARSKPESIVFAKDGHVIKAMIIHDSVRKLIKNSETNVRLNGSHLPRGPHIQSVPAEQANREQRRHADHQQTSHYHRNQVVVKFKATPAKSELNDYLHRFDAVIKQQWQRIVIFESGNASAERMQRFFSKLASVEYAEAHYLYTTNQKQTGYLPNDPLYVPYQWNIRRIRGDQAWRLAKGNGKVTVAVVDTGIDLKHPDLVQHLRPGYNSLREAALPQDDVGHGTHVAGIIAAQINNVDGIAGLSWYNPLMPIKVLDETGSGDSFAVAQGIIWATDRGAKVINLSLGNYAQGKFLHDAVKYAYKRDVLLVAAAGNESTDQLSYPAAYPEVLAVTATDEKNRTAPFSNFGSHIDLAAPGVHIASTFPDQAYAALSGTSMAAPHVSAVAALVRSAYPHLKNSDVMNILRQSATDIGKPRFDSQSGYGLLNAEQALRHAATYDNKRQSGTHTNETPPPTPPVTQPNPVKIWLLKLWEKLKNPLTWRVS